MVSARLLFSLVAVPLVATAAIVACGDDGESKTVPTTEGGTSSSGGSSSGGTSSSGSSSGDPEPDSSTDDDATAPAGDGGGPCGTHPFGKAGVNFQGIVDASDNGPYVGGAFELSSYDAVIAERLSGNPGAWRETFVVSANNRFSRIRATDFDGGGLGEPKYRSGTYSSTDAGQLLLTFDCAIDGDASITDPSDTFPFEVVTVNGKKYYRYGAAGVRIWLERR